MKYYLWYSTAMASVIVIPIIIVTIVGLAGYLIYKFLIFDASCKRSVNQMLQKYKIDKTPLQIIKEYHNLIGESISEKEARSIEKRYRQNEPDQFLTMYDKIRENMKR